MSHPELDGLKFKPFFGSALAANRVNGQQSLVNQTISLLQ
jgi:hypothetical protein